MVSSGMLRRVSLVRTDVTEELSTSSMVTRIGELRLLVTASVVPSSPILVTLTKETLSSSETSILTKAALRNIPEDTILHSHYRENLKTYTKNFVYGDSPHYLEVLEQNIQQRELQQVTRNLFKRIQACL
jgi:predicted PP-loop superfamily ATPase